VRPINFKRSMKPQPNSWFDQVWNPVGVDCARACCTEHAQRIGLVRLAGWAGQRVLVGPAYLFDTRVPDDVIRDMFMVMAKYPQHVFRVLAKNTYRMEQWFGTWACHQVEEWAISINVDWPLPNVQLGIVVSDQETLEDRIGSLLASPAVARFIVVDKFRGFIDLTHVICPAEIYSKEQVRACSICNGVRAICEDGQYNALRGGIDEVVLCDINLDEASALFHDDLCAKCDEHQVSTIDLLDRGP
jgi:hypothetical protein